MLKKNYSKHGGCRVTFKLPREVGAQKAHLCGDFNGWDEFELPMKVLKDGSFSVTVSLDQGDYKFRYLLDDSRWENDWAADAYVPNPFGAEDSLIAI